MKKLVLIIMITTLLPFCSFAQFVVNPGNNYYSQGDGANDLNFIGGKKKKKPAPKKGAKEDPKKDKAKQKKQKETVDYGLNFFAGPDLAFGFPMGKIRDSVNNGIGFNIRAEYFYTPNINLGLWTGFKSYKYDEVMVGKGHFSYIPIKLTGTYYFGNGSIRPYANFGLGLYMVKQKYDAETWIMVRNPQTNRLDTIYEKKHLNESQTKFGFSPSVGVLYNVQDEFFINANMSYEMILTDKNASNFLGINFGLLYKFGF